MIHFKLLSYVKCDIWIKILFSFFLFPVLFLEKTALSSLNCPCVSVAIQLAKCVWVYFWIICSVPLVCVFVFH